MKSLGQLEHEVAGIIFAAVAEEATEQDLQRLDNIISKHPQLAEFVVDLMSQEAWFNWHAAQTRTGNIRNELLVHIAQIAQAATAPLVCASDSTKVDKRSGLHTMALKGSRYFNALAALLLVAIGAVLGMSMEKWRKVEQIAGKSFPTNESDPVDSDNYVARLVHGTACLWNQEINPALNSDDALRMGESLSLLEGLAELELDWKTGGAVLRIEGPAGLVLTAERGASLSHGKFTADVKASDGHFNLNTPAGVLQVVGGASLGVSILGGDVEVHLFKGNAQFIGPWTQGIRGARPVQIDEGEAIRIVTNTEGRLSIDRELASPSSFVSKVSMGSDHLLIRPEYIREILAAKPVLYWRFEDRDPQKVANEVSTRYHGHLKGVADRVRQVGNTSLELGAGLSEETLQSFIYCDEPLKEDFSLGYSVETWFKPSHYHWGSLIALLADPPQPGWRAPHGLLLEMGGPRLSDSEIEHPGRIRYLHRSPPGEDFNTGTSCFSETVYELRKWQHIVAVKDENSLRLYINGKQVAQGQDSSTLVDGMKVTIGQLDREQFYRKFIGQIDEFAIYSRPLSEQEIVKRYEMTRPGWKKPDDKQNPANTAQLWPTLEIGKS